MLKAGVLRRFYALKLFLDSPAAIAPQYNQIRPYMAFLEDFPIPEDDNTMVDIGAENTASLLFFLGWRHSIMGAVSLDRRWNFTPVFEQCDLMTLNEFDCDNTKPSSFTEYIAPKGKMQILGYSDHDGRLTT
jgi:hypothetical protein